MTPPWHSLPLTQAGLSAGALRATSAAGYTTLGEVAALTPTELRRVKGLGPVYYKEVRATIKRERSAQARALLASGMSLRQAAKVLGVASPETVRTWAKEGQERS